MRKKEHSGSAAVIGAQLVILFILTVSLCVQSRKAAAVKAVGLGSLKKPGKRGTAKRKNISTGWNLMFRRT